MTANCRHNCKQTAGKLQPHCKQIESKLQARSTLQANCKQTAWKQQYTIFKRTASKLQHSKIQANWKQIASTLHANKHTQIARQLQANVLQGRWAICFFSLSVDIFSLGLCPFGCSATYWAKSCSFSTDLGGMLNLESHTYASNFGPWRVKSST